MSDSRLHASLALLRTATIGTKFEGILWLVGGYVRDKLLGLKTISYDIDIVLEGSSAELADHLENCGITQHAPVTYPRFGTAMVTIADVAVELVTARRESYAAGSRKPDHVEPATVFEDALRRDFTINTLLENLHSGQIIDPLGTGMLDIERRTVRTPLPARETFVDDPLRMLRAIRFAARFEFDIDSETWDAIEKNSNLLMPTVSAERIRDEFCKILLDPRPAYGLTLLLDAGILDRFAPELTAMVGVTQNEFHAFPVWEHTLAALTSLVQASPDAPLLLRLGILLHDCGKPSTRTQGPDGRVHFYGHQDAGAKIARNLLLRLKFSHSDTDSVTALVAQHMRIGEYKPTDWSDAAVRRFIRSAGPQLDWLFMLHRADVAGLGEQFQDISRSVQLRSRIDELLAKEDVVALDSPLSGAEIMRLLPIKPGPDVGKIKSALAEAVIEGVLAPSDKDAAQDMARKLFNSFT